MAGLENIPTVQFFLFSLFTHCEIQPGQRLYVLEARLSVVDKDFKPIHGSILLSHFGSLQPLETSIGVVWLIKNEWLLDGKQDLLYSIDWDILAAIFQHHAKIRFAGDGEPFDELTYNRNVGQNPDPLKHLGLLGWPTVVDRVPTLLRREENTGPIMTLIV